MSATLRKLVVGLIALAALVGIFLLYTRASRTPAIIADLTPRAPVSVADVNAAAPSAGGTVLGIDINRVEQTRFLHRNERNQVDRDFGFDQLLHQQGKQWEITKPYLKLFFPTFRCEVTANRGKVQVDAMYSQLIAGDAQFLGNVVIHIVPREPNDAMECFIHLDDVEFLAAKSLFSSAGAVRFLSRRAQLTGTGLELLYDGARNRLELFRIFDLDSLRLRSRELGSVADLTPRRRSADDAPSQAPGAGPESKGRGPETTPSGGYQCTFHRNIAIEMPDRVVTAREDFTINNILWSGAPKPGTQAKPVLDSEDPNAAPYPGPNALDTTASSHAAISSIPLESFDTIVTCEGGFAVTPMGGGLLAAERGQKTGGSAFLRPRSSVVHPPLSESSDRQRARAQRILFDALSTDTTLDGPVEMAFSLDPNGLRTPKAAAGAMPMTITAQTAVRFLAASNQVFFEGGCKVTLTRTEPSLVYEYLLTAPRLVVDIASDSKGTKGYNVTARRLVTDGGPAALRILRKSPDKLLGETELDAAQLQYAVAPDESTALQAARAGSAEFTAVGPGVIWIRNDEAINPKADPNQFSLARPCVARLMNFDTLKYFTATNRIIAEDDAQQLLLDYFPLVNGKYARHMRAVAGHVEASLQEMTKGHLELATLTATQGIEYVDEGEKNAMNFVGSTLSYDYSQALVAIRGDAQQHCYLNGSLVDQIDLNLKTGRVQAEFPAPSVFQVRR